MEELHKLRVSLIALCSIIEETIPLIEARASALDDDEMHYAARTFGKIAKRLRDTLREHDIRVREYRKDGQQGHPAAR